MALRLGLGNAAATTEQAIIDIGSNTVRLVIYGGPPRAPASRPRLQSFRAPFRRPRM